MNCAFFVDRQLSTEKCNTFSRHDCENAICDSNVYVKLFTIRGIYVEIWKAFLISTNIKKECKQCKRYTKSKCHVLETIVGWRLKTLKYSVKFCQPSILGIPKILERGKILFRLMSFKNLARANTMIYVRTKNGPHHRKMLSAFLKILQTLEQNIFKEVKTISKWRY